MADTQRAIVMLSVEDVIRILESTPVKSDLVPEFMVMKFMNRAPVAHLSIERALKWLISAAGGEPKNIHNLKELYLELLRLDPASGEFLERAFQTAVQHYRYNPNATGMRHLKTLESYLAAAGTDEAFQAMRYWELNQSARVSPLQHVFLPVHIELLYALRELLLAPERPKDTVVSRVERTVVRAMADNADLAYGSGDPKEESINAYITWLHSFSSWREALAHAVQSGFNVGDDFLNNLTHTAYISLLRDHDPAVSYFVSTLDVLPTQPRDLIPCVEWLGPQQYRHGSVTTPSGAPLGFIERGPDGLWYITPLQEGLVRVSAKAQSQTDARCYLARLLTTPARASVAGQDQNLRIVGERHNLIQKNYEEIHQRFEGQGNEDTWTHKIVLWDTEHGLKINQKVRIEVPIGEDEVLVNILEGRVLEVAEHEITLSGSDWIDIAQPGGH